jgi:glycine hydroxymethyltransferase
VIAEAEPAVSVAMRAELAGQRDSLKLIASENYASPAVPLTMGSWLGDEYAEGTVGHPSYAGCEHVDTIESLAADHAKALFGAPHACVQPYSGDANLVAFGAILAHRVEAPGLAAAGARRVNDLSDTELGRDATSLRGSACARDVARCRWAPHARVPVMDEEWDAFTAAVTGARADDSSR